MTDSAYIGPYANAYAAVGAGQGIEFAISSYPDYRVETAGGDAVDKLSAASDEALREVILEENFGTSHRGDAKPSHMHAPDALREPNSDFSVERAYFAAVRAAYAANAAVLGNSDFGHHPKPLEDKPETGKGADLGTTSEDDDLSDLAQRTIWPDDYLAALDGQPEPTDRLAVRLVELREQLETVYDLLTGLDMIGDAIGGDRGHAVSEVALQARSYAESAQHTVRAMGHS